MRHSLDLRRHLQYFIPGQIFTSGDLSYLGNRAATDTALSRMVKEDKAVRLTSGVYSYESSGYDLPSPWVVAAAKARSMGVDFYHCKSIYAAVPHKDPRGRSIMVAVKMDGENSHCFYSSQGNARFRYKGRLIVIKQIAPKRMHLLQQAAGEFLYSMLMLGRVFHQQHPYFLDDAISRLERYQKASLSQSIRYLPGWMIEMLRDHMHYKVRK